MNASPIMPLTNMTIAVHRMKIGSTGLRASRTAGRRYSANASYREAGKDSDCRRSNGDRLPGTGNCGNPAPLTARLMKPIARNAEDRLIPTVWRPTAGVGTTPAGLR